MTKSEIASSPPERSILGGPPGSGKRHQMVDEPKSPAGWHPVSQPAMDAKHGSPTANLVASGRIAMRTSPPSRRARATSETTKTLLVEAVIGLVFAIPFPEITARRIASEIDMDPNVIFRNYGSVENLMVAALREMENRLLALLGPEPDPGFTLVEYAQPWVEFSSWLYLSGTSVEKLRARPAILQKLRDLTLQRLGLAPSASERTKAAVFALATSFLEAQAILAHQQPDIFTPGARADSAALFQVFIAQLERLTPGLGWDDEGR